MTHEEIEKRMDELARKYVETHDPEIIKELNRLSRQLQELEKHFRRW
jgi:FKBP-type peptidyl-prolyl cis-trans isomerase (trigger factor)